MPIMSGMKAVGVSLLPSPLRFPIWAQLMWLMYTNSLALGAVLEESIGKLFNQFEHVIGLMSIPIISKMKVGGVSVFTRPLESHI